VLGGGRPAVEGDATVTNPEQTRVDGAAPRPGDPVQPASPGQPASPSAAQPASPGPAPSPSVGQPASPGSVGQPASAGSVGQPASPGQAPSPSAGRSGGQAPTPPTPAREGELLERTVFEVKRVIVGQDRLVERMLVGLLSKGHLLLEGVPGVAKTLAVETFAKVVGGSFARLQFTPDLVPADILGTRIYRQGREEFDVELGPVVANFVLADEINRAPAKVQSAMLEVMAERHLSIGGKTFPMPNPFLVLATQNPIENEGVYPLPEAQRDRFLFKIMIEYPNVEEEREIIYRMGVEPPVAEQILTPAELVRLQGVASRVFVHHALVDYVVRLVVATRSPAEHGLDDVAGWVSYGASPRASLGIVAAARALALVRGRDYVLPQDVMDVAPDVLRHRLVLSYDAVADAVPIDHILSRVLQTVPLPQVSSRPQYAASS
jgi:MoxR-like ATPase